MSFLSGLGGILGAVAAPFTGGASLLPSLIGGGASIVGGLLQNNSAKSLAQSSNAQAIELANTQHQREVKDLQAAGLNPILSAGGNGAAVPSMQTPTVGNVLGSAVGSAMQAQLSQAQIEQVKSQTEQTKVSTDFTKQQLEDLKRYGGSPASGIMPSAIGALRRSIEHLPPAARALSLALFVVQLSIFLQRPSLKRGLLIVFLPLVSVALLAFRLILLFLTSSMLLNRLPVAV